MNKTLQGKLDAVLKLFSFNHEFDKGNLMYRPISTLIDPDEVAMQVTSAVTGQSVAYIDAKRRDGTLDPDSEIGEVFAEVRKQLQG